MAAKRHKEDEMTERDGKWKDEEGRGEEVQDNKKKR